MVVSKTITFVNFGKFKPVREDKSYLLKFKRTYTVANWGEEKQMFYDGDSGDYIESKDFMWAELPD